MVGSVRELQDFSIEARLVGGEHIATAILISLQNFLVLFKGYDFIFHLIGLEIIRKVEFGGGAGLGAN